MIDNIYNRHDKSQYYIGRISQVKKEYCNVQCENLSILNNRILGNEEIIPNTIDYLVVIDSQIDIFIGKVVQNKIKNSDTIHKKIQTNKIEEIYPDLSIEIFGIINNQKEKIIPSSYKYPGIRNKVYIANKKIMNWFLKAQEINEFNSKETISFAKSSNYHKIPFYINPNTIFNRHFISVGSTGSGKSTTSLSILSQLNQKRKKFLIIDPTGEYNKSFDSINDGVKILKLGTDTNINTKDLSISDWVNLLQASPGIQAPSLMKAIQSLRLQYKKQSNECLKKQGQKVVDINNKLRELSNNDLEFNFNLLNEQILEESVKEEKGKFKIDDFLLKNNQILVDRIKYKIQSTFLFELFEKDEIKEYSLVKELKSFLENDSSLLIDISKVSSEDITGGVLIDLISKVLITLKIDKSPFVLFIDEVHRYLKNYNEDENISFNQLSNIAREGRKNGIFLFLTTQNPTDIPNTILGQIGTLLIHRLSQSKEIYSIKEYISTDSIEYLKKLRIGEGILSSVNLTSDLILKIDESSRKHDNDTPEI